MTTALRDAVKMVRLAMLVILVTKMDVFVTKATTKDGIRRRLLLLIIWKVCASMFRREKMQNSC